MLDKMNEQFKDSMKPVTELATLNMTTFQTLVEKQSALFSALLSGSVSFAETASQQKDAASYAEAQNKYLTSVQETVTAAAKEAYTLVSGSQAKVGEVVKTIGEGFTANLSVAGK